jgi:site-specific recombinase XerD
MKLTINFNLRDYKPVSKPQSIRAVIRIPVGGNKYEKLVYTTPYKVAPKNFNDETQRIKNVTDEGYRRDAVNHYLDTLYNDAQIYFAQTMTNKQGFTLANLKSYLDERNNPKESDLKKYLIAYIESFISNAPQRKNETGVLISYRTIQKYNTTLKHLKEFQESMYKRDLEFKDIDISFYDRFTSYLTTKGMKPNSIGRYVATLKVFLNQATLEGLEVRQDYKHKTFRATKEKVESVYLNEDELLRLYEFDLSDNKRLEKVRDLFVLAAWTGGVRYSDYEKISKNNIIRDSIGNYDLYIIQQKTKEKIVIPLTDRAMKILEKYNGNPTMISSQKLNDYIKEVCQLVGINDKIMITETKGGVKSSKIFEKWQLVASHTARRSFATNSILKGMDYETVANITGHKNMTTFKNYVKTTAKEKADIFRASEKRANERQAEERRKLKIA